MKKNLLFLTLCFAVLSCDTSSDMDPSTHSITGFWSRETVYLNGVNSIEYVDFLNNGTNFLSIKNDKTFERAYDNGSWNLSCKTLVLDREEPSGLGDWTYEIIEHSDNNLTLEIKLTESQYCCGFDSFTDNEIITIREVYKRSN
jgi:hypothetical protein